MSSILSTSRAPPSKPSAMFEDLDLDAEISQILDMQKKDKPEQVEKVEESDDSPKPSRMHTSVDSSSFVSQESSVEFESSHMESSKYKSEAQGTPSRISRQDRGDPDYV